MASRLTGRVAAVAAAVVVAGLAVVLAIVAAGNSASPSEVAARTQSTARPWTPSRRRTRSRG